MAGEGVIWKLQRLVSCQVGPVLWSFNKEEKRESITIGCDRGKLKRLQEWFIFWDPCLCKSVNKFKIFCLLTVLIGDLTPTAMIINPYLVFFSWVINHFWFYYIVSQKITEKWIWIRGARLLLYEYDDNKDAKYPNTLSCTDTKMMLQWQERYNQPFYNQVCIYVYSLIEKQMFVSFFINHIMAFNTSSQWKYLRRQMDVFEI